jgi:la-related protein 1
MYDVNGYPMSAMPYPVHPDIHNLTMMISMQLEYYFSVDNLLKDTFLRRHMDSQGFVFLDVIANFNRIKQLTQDKDLLKAVCIDSSVIEIRVGEDGKERLRRQEGWQQFPFEMDQRDPSAQNKGPEHLERIERPQVAVNNIPPQYRGPASAGIPPMHPRFDRRSYDSQYAMMEGYAHQLHWGGGFSDDMYNEGFNGDEVRGRTVKSPTNETVLSPKREHTPAPPAESGVADQDPFPDDQTAALTVVVRMGEKRASYHSAASRTFSNGSIDSRNALPESEPPSSSKSKPLVNGDSHINGGEDGSKHTRHISPNKVSSTERPATNTDVNNVFWVKDQEYPVESLPQGINSYPYNQLRSESLEQRNEARTGTCPPKLNILYEFWCHFLIRNFNSGMYSEFKRLANEDASDRYDFVGLQNLVKFYAQSLSSQNMIRDQVARDYVQLVNEEPAKLENAAFKSLRSAWRNGALNLKNRKKLANVLDDKLKEKLDSTAA